MRTLHTHTEAAPVDVLTCAGGLTGTFSNMFTELLVILLKASAPNDFNVYLFFG